MGAMTPSVAEYLALNSRACRPSRKAAILSYAYVEFASADAVQKAMVINGFPHRGRNLKVQPKVTKQPDGNDMQMTNAIGAPPPAAGGGFRGRGGGGYRGRGGGRFQ